jgi:hypothetical protein
MDAKVTQGLQIYYSYVARDTNDLLGFATFPPDLDLERTDLAFNNAINNMNLANFEEKGVCACCSLQLPNLVDASITMCGPFSTSFIKPFLACLTWNESNSHLKPFALTNTQDHSFTLVEEFALHPNGILPFNEVDSECQIILCSRCWNQMRSEPNVLPKYSLANGLYNFSFHDLGLPELTFVEEKIIAKVRLNSFVIKLTCQQKHSQKAFKGHVIGFPQNPDKLLIHTKLPLPASELPDLMNILFVSQKNQGPDLPPTLTSFHKIFSVSKEKIRLWLNFLKR